MFLKLSVCAVLVAVCIAGKKGPTKCEKERDDPTRRYKRSGYYVSGYSYIFTDFNYLTTSSSSSSYDGTIFTPSCDKKGNYEPVQCQDRDARFCFCVDKKGEEVYGTRAKNAEDVPDCRKRKPSQCELERYEILQTHYQVAKSVWYETSSTSYRNDGYLPECEPEKGRYEEIQCKDSYYSNMEHCFCVDKKTGEKIYGTERKYRSDIDKCPKKPLTKCQIERYEFLYEGKFDQSYSYYECYWSYYYSSDDRPCRSYAPECTKKGDYERTQCNSCECWCVDTEGEKKPGTEGPYGEVKCKKDKKKGDKKNKDNKKNKKGKKH